MRHFLSTHIFKPTHIDVLTGDYESCVRYNIQAIAADRHAMECSPATAGRESFYFGYMVVRAYWHIRIVFGDVVVEIRFGSLVLNPQCKTVLPIIDDCLTFILHRTISSAQLSHGGLWCDFGRHGRKSDGTGR